MSGNAFEWCYDWYGPYSDVDQVNPKGPSDADKDYVYAGKTVSTHVLRGGHWQSSSFGLRVSFRTKIPTSNYKPKAGFRIARGIPYSQMNNYSAETGTDSPSDELGKYASGTLPFRMKKIASSDGTKPILVMYLHGGSSKGNDNETQMNEKAVGVIAEYLTDNAIPSIFIVPQCPSSGSWGAKMNEPLAKLLEEYEASCDGIYVLGGSMGGTGTWSLTNTYSEKFRGIMPVAGKPGTASAWNFKSMRVCTVMSEADEVMKTAYEDVKAFCNSINAAGGNTNCTIVPVSEQWSHQTTCEQSYTTERLRWLFGK